MNEIEINKTIAQAVLSEEFRLYYGAKELARMFSFNETYIRQVLKDMYHEGLSLPSNPSASKLHLRALPYKVEQFLLEREMVV